MDLGRLPKGNGLNPHRRGSWTLCNPFISTRISLSRIWTSVVCLLRPEKWGLSTQLLLAGICYFYSPPFTIKFSSIQWNKKHNNFWANHFTSGCYKKTVSHCTSLWQKASVKWWVTIAQWSKAEALLNSKVWGIEWI